MKTAYWTKKTHLLRADEYICSRCGQYVRKPMKYCPFCKSKMTKEKYDASWVDEAEGLSAVLDDDW